MDREIHLQILQYTFKILAKLWRYIAQCFVYLLYPHERYCCMCLFYHVTYTEIRRMWWCGLGRRRLCRVISSMTTRGVADGGRVASRQLSVVSDRVKVVRLSWTCCLVMLSIDSTAGWQDGPTFETWPIYRLSNALTHNQVIQLLMIWDHLLPNSVLGCRITGMWAPSWRRDRPRFVFSPRWGFLYW